MKTNYPLRNKSKNRKRTYASIFVVVLSVVVGAGIFSLVGGPLSRAFAPLWKGQSLVSQGVAATFSLFEPKSSLVRENVLLKEYLQRQEAELISLRSIKERESELLTLLSRPTAPGKILSSVLVRPPETPYDVLVVDAGERDGVMVGQSVSMPEGPLLGVVSEVFSTTAKVKLYSSDGERTNAILERHQVPVILLGQGGGNFKLTLPRDVAVEEGDRILEAGISSGVLAVVGKVNMNPTDSFKEVLARGASSIFTLRYVLVQP